MSLDVRRLAAVDLHGAHGRRTRRIIILAEFLLGAIVMPIGGVLTIASTSGAAWTLFGVWLATAGVNYVPLSIHAIRFWNDERLADELAGADLGRELRHYTAVQVWVFVPLALVVFAVVQWRAGSGASEARRS